MKFLENNTCQCPLGLLPHFYGDVENVIAGVKALCQCPLGLLPHFYDKKKLHTQGMGKKVSMPSRAVTSFLLGRQRPLRKKLYTVSMPSRAVTSFLRPGVVDYVWVREDKRVNALSGCYLISTSFLKQGWTYNIIVVSMPSRAVTSFLRRYHDGIFMDCTRIVSMPSRAVTSFLRYCSCYVNAGLRFVSMPSRAVTSFLRGHPRIHP